YRTRLARRLFDGHGPGDLERHFTRIDVVRRPVHQLHLHVHHRIARQDAVLERFLHALLHRPDELARHGAANDLVLEHEAGARLARLEVDNDVAVLAAAAGLADELPFDVFHPLAHRFAVRHLGAADIGLDLEFALHAVDDDLEVQLAHPRNDRL